MYEEHKMFGDEIDELTAKIDLIVQEAGQYSSVNNSLNTNGDLGEASQVTVHSSLVL